MHSFRKSLLLNFSLKALHRHLVDLWLYNLQLSRKKQYCFFTTLACYMQSWLSSYDGILRYVFGEKYSYSGGMFRYPFRILSQYLMPDFAMSLTLHILQPFSCPLNRKIKIALFGSPESLRQIL